MRYPFNKYGWHDFKYKHFTQKRFWKKLGKNIDSICPWDITDSSIDIIFENFRLFYNEYKHRFYPINDAMKYYFVDDGCSWHPDTYLNNIFEHANIRKQAYIKINMIGEYVNSIRKENYEIYEYIQHEMFKDSIEELKKGSWKGNIKSKRFFIRYKILECGEVEYYGLDEITDPDGENFYEFSDKLHELDNLFSKMIIDVRQYLWD